MLNIQAGARGANPCVMLMRVVFVISIQPPPPKATVVALKWGEMILQPGAQFQFKPEELEPFSVSANSLAKFLGSAILHMEETGSEPSLIPGDTKSALFLRK